MRWLLALAITLWPSAPFATDATDWRPLTSPGPEWNRVPAAGIYYGDITVAYPAVAKLLIGHAGGTGLCTGTLIAPTVVLTAAHCIREDIMGVNAVFFDGVQDTGYKAVGYAINPDYTPAQWPRADVALLALEHPVAGIAPVPVAVAPPAPRSRGIIVGFGEDTSKQVGVKRTGAVRLRRCPRRPFPLAGIEAGGLDQSLCWRPRGRHADTCYGDSGGPLIVDGMLAGVTSGGYPRCHGRVSWDTNVALFRGWIEAQVAGSSQ
jgi:hypothetical protein